MKIQIQVLSKRNLERKEISFSFKFDQNFVKNPKFQQQGDTKVYFKKD